MLQIIRDKAQGWVAWVIISALVASFSLWGIQSYLQAQSNTQAVAKVDGEKITLNTLNAAYQRFVRQLKAQSGKNTVVTPELEKQIKSQSLTSLISSIVLKKSAQDDGVRISDQQVGAALAEISAFQVNGQFSAERFAQITQSLLYSQPEFLAELKASMMIGQIRSGIVNSDFVLPMDINRTISLTEQKRDLGYTLITADNFKKDVRPAQKDIQAYYEQHHDEFKTPEKVSIEYVTLSVHDLIPSISFSDSQIKEYYQENIDSYRTPLKLKVAHILIQVPTDADQKATENAKQKADSLFQKISNGADFSELAKANSDDILTAKSGGVMDWFSPGMVGSEFENAAMSLKKIGSVTKPERTQYGYEIIKLLAKQDAKVKPLSEVKTQVEKAYADQIAAKKFSELSEKLSNITYTDPSSLDSVTTQLKLPVLKTGYFTEQGGTNSITKNPKVIQAAFSSDVLAGNNSDIIELSPQSIIVLRLLKHLPSSIKPLAEVQQEITNILKTKQAAILAQQFAEKMISDAKLSTLESAAKSKGYTWKTMTHVSRNDSQLNPIILNKAFTIPSTAKGQETTLGFSLPNGDYAIVTVNHVYPGDTTRVDNENHNAIKQHLAEHLGQLSYQSYVNSLISNADIVHETTK